MRWLNRFFSRCARTFGRVKAERELAREIEAHLALLADDFQSRGMSSDEARLAARRAFGGVEQTKELHREERSFMWLEQVVQDVRHAARGLRKSPVFAAAALLVLGLGIAGAITVFCFLNALVLNPYPYTQPGRLVEIQFRGKSEGDGWRTTVRIRDFFEFQAQSAVFEAMGAYSQWRHSLNLTGQSLPGLTAAERIDCGEASGGFLRVLGVHPALGRFFDASEDLPGGPPVVLLSYGAWKSRYAGRPDVLGQTVDLSGKTYTIIGVMPAGLRLPGVPAYELWRPAAYDPAVERGMRMDGDSLVARLKPGVPLGRADADLGLIERRLAMQYPETNGGWEVRAIPMAQEVARHAGRLLWAPMAAVGLVLLLACVNLAGLLLARGAARSKEMAVRASLGASGFRLVRQMLTEALLLSLLGGVLAMVLARWAIGLLQSAFPRDWGIDAALRIDTPVLAFACGVTLLTSVLFGLVPAVHGSRTDLNSTLKGMAVAGAGAPRNRLLSGLVVVEVALALVLLAGGGLLMKSFVRLLRVDLGIRSDHLLTFEIGLSGSKYRSENRRSVFFDDLMARMRRLPGVSSAAAVDALPMGGYFSGGGFTIEGRPAPPFWRDMAAQYCSATPAYFRTMGIPVMLGREFDERDRDGAPVAIVSQALARRFFPNQNPLGHHINEGRTIVGVIGDVRHGGPARDSEPQIYYPFPRKGDWGASVALRTAGDPLRLAQLVRGEVRALDPSLPIDKIRSMEQVVAESLAEPRLVTFLMSGFAMFALLLVAIGLYGLVAYSVNRRRHEIGVRIALGAGYANVLGLVLRQGALLSVLGAALGTPAALAASRLLRSLLHGTQPTDASVFAAVSLLLVLVALAASFVPAHGAARLNTLAALREE